VKVSIEVPELGISMIEASRDPGMFGTEEEQLFRAVVQGAGRMAALVLEASWALGRPVDMVVRVEAEPKRREGHS
jgi:hypothetical protein